MLHRQEIGPIGVAAGGTGYVAMDFGVVIRGPGGDSPPWVTLRVMLFIDDRRINEVFLEFFWLFYDF